MTIVPGKTPCLRCLIETAPPPGMTPDLRDRRRARAGRGGDRVVRGHRGHQAARPARWDALNVHLIMVDVWDWTFRQLKVAGLARQGRLPVLRAAAIRVARRGDGLAHDHPVRPQRRPGRRPARRAARLSPSWPGGSTESATSGTTPSCSGSRPTATSSPSSPTAARSSRGPTTSPRRGRCMLSMWGASNDLPRQRRDQLSQARAGLSGPRPLRPHQPGEPGQGRASHGRRRRAGARRGAARAQPVLSRRGPRALDLHAQLHRRTEPRDQGDRPARRSRRHHRPRAQLDQQAAGRASRRPA